MSYVQAVLGGSIRGVNPNLLVLTSTSHIGGATRKTLRNAIAALEYVTPSGGGTEYSGGFSVEDPLASIKQKMWLTIPTAAEYIETFIETTTGLHGSTLVTQLNHRYSEVYGAGQAGSLPDAAVESVFGEDWAPESTEYIYAEQILDLLQSRVGNVTGIYLELGGGRSGVIGGINQLYDHLSNHEMTVSESDPDNSVGKDGDLWFKFGNEEEEE